MNADTAFLEILNRVKNEGRQVETRNSVCKRITPGTSALATKDFSPQPTTQYTFDRTPLVTVRKTSWKNCLREWEWFMSGSNNVNDLHESVRHWWKPWAEESGELWAQYGEQLRHFSMIDPKNGFADQFDQIEYLIDGVKNHPNSRRNVITTWNTPEMAHPFCKLTCCHGTIIQAFVEDYDQLHLVTYQRSADVVCGLPHNWCQYWAFMLWLAHRSGREPGRLTWIGGDVHVYQAHDQLADKIEFEVDVARESGLTAVLLPRRLWFDNAPQLVYTPTSEDFKADDFTLDRPYEPLVTDKAEMIV